MPCGFGADMVAYGETIAKAAATSKFEASAFLDYEALKASLYELEEQHLREPLEENALSASLRRPVTARAEILGRKLSTRREIRFVESLSPV